MPPPLLEEFAGISVINKVLSIYIFLYSCNIIHGILIDEDFDATVND